MSRKEYVVTLTPDEREYLARLISVGKVSARALIRARILLKADASPTGPGWDDARIAEALDVSISTVGRVRQSFTKGGLKESVSGKPPDHTSRRPRLDGRRLQEVAHQSPRNFGKKRSTWTLQLLADTCSEIEVALHTPQGDTGEVGDLLMGQTVTLQPVRDHRPNRSR